MFGEHIEETIKLFKENEVPLDPDAIAEAVLDIAYAQGLLGPLDEAGVALAHKQIADEARYMLTPAAELASGR